MKHGQTRFWATGFMILTAAALFLGAGMTGSAASAEPDITISINGQTSYRLQSENEVIRYEITTEIPLRSGMSSFEIELPLVNEMEFVDPNYADMRIGGTWSSAPVYHNTSYSGNETVTVDLGGHLTAADQGKTVSVTFRARMKSGADLSAYTGGVPAAANYRIDGGAVMKQSNEVLLQPFETHGFLHDGSSIYAPAGHGIKDWKTVTAPANGTDGLREYICDCGHVEYVTVPYEDHGLIQKTNCESGSRIPNNHHFNEPRWHAFASWSPDEHPGPHQQPSVWRYHCSCGYEETQQYAHAWDSGVITIPPTETEEGEKTFTCTDCGRLYKETLAKLPHTTHTWDDGKVTKAATVTAAGEKTFTCTICGTTKKEPVARLTASSNAGTSNTGRTSSSNAVTSRTERTSSNTTGHSNTGRTSSDTADTARTTGGNNADTGRSATQPAAPAPVPLPVRSADGTHTHDWISAVSSVPNMQTEGARDYICMICGEEHGESIARLSCDHAGTGRSQVPLQNVSRSGYGYVGTVCTSCGKLTHTARTHPYQAYTVSYADGKTDVVYGYFEDQSMQDRLAPNGAPGNRPFLQLDGTYGRVYLDGQKTGIPHTAQIPASGLVFRRIILSGADAGPKETRIIVSY